MFDKQEITALLAKWQDILRLRDWDINIEFVGIPWRKTGDIKIDADDKKAVLMVNFCNPKRETPEVLVIHELLHVKLWAMAQMIESVLLGVHGQNRDSPAFEFAYTQFMTAL